MRKIAVVLCLAFALAGTAFALPPTYLLTTESLLSQTSFGLFTNAFDAAFNESDAGKQLTFSTLTDAYLFSGLANDFAGLVGSQPTTPLTMGYHAVGQNPWSVFGDLIVQSAQSTLNDGTVTTSATKSTVPSDGTTYSWDSQSVASTYAFHQALNMAGDEMFLIGLGGLNLGAVVNWAYQQNSSGAATSTWMGNNLTQHTVVNYDTAAASAAPTAAMNYTSDLTTSKPDTTFDIGLMVPLYFTLGSIGIDLQPKVELNRYDASVTNTLTYSAPNTPTGSSFTIPAGALNTTTDVTGWMYAGLGSTASLPSLIGGDARNLFLVNLDGYLKLYTADPKSVVTNTSAETWNYAGGGAAFTYAGVNQSDTASTRTGTVAYRVAPSAQQLVYVDLGGGAVWAIGPKVDLEMNFVPSVTNYSTTDTVKTSTDGNANGTFTDAADTIVTKVITYNHGGDGGTWNWVGGIEIPVALTFHPAGSFFGATVGANPRVLYTLASVSSTTLTSSQAITATDGTGASIAVPGGVTTVQAGTASTTTRTVSSWTFDSGFEMSFDFYLPANAMIQVQWSGAGTLTFQATVPLK